MLTPRFLRDRRRVSVAVHHWSQCASSAAGSRLAGLKSVPDGVRDREQARLGVLLVGDAEQLRGLAVAVVHEVDRGPRRCPGHARGAASMKLHAAGRIEPQNAGA